MSALFYCGRFRLSLDRPLIMGIVNATDDSFSGDGYKGDWQRTVDRIHELIEEGADIIDIGAESTRPGAPYLSVQHELDRLLPILEHVGSIRCPISIDTNKTEVMKAVLEAGASMINDIRALQAPGAIELLSGTDAGICLMHMQNDPETMQVRPEYDDIVTSVESFLYERVGACLAAGIAPERITLDMGFGFGKTVDHNILLFQSLRRFHEMGYPLLVGVSRKSFLGHITGREVNQRASISAAAAMLAVQAGASIVRVHDVAETRAMLDVLAALGTDYPNERK